MNLVKVVNQYFDTDNPNIIIETEDNKYYELVSDLNPDGICIGWKPITDIVRIGYLDFKRNAK